MGQIKVEKNAGGIEGLCVIEPKVFGDSRGYFVETYNKQDMVAKGLDRNLYRIISPSLQRSASWSALPKAVSAGKTCAGHKGMCF